MPQLRQLLAQRKTYYINNGQRPQVTLKALENFANGLPAKVMLEENMAQCKASGDWDDEMEQIAEKLLAERTISSDESQS